MQHAMHMEYTFQGHSGGGGNRAISVLTKLSKLVTRKIRQYPQQQ